MLHTDQPLCPPGAAPTPIPETALPSRLSSGLPGRLPQVFLGTGFHPSYCAENRIGPPAACGRVPEEEEIKEGSFHIPRPEANSIVKEDEMHFLPYGKKADFYC